MISIHDLAEESAGAAICPFCRAMLRKREALVRCIGCGTWHHKACWKENDCRCSVFRCSEIGPNPAAGAPNGILLRWLVTLHCALNVTIHFFIHPVGKLVEYIHPADAFALLALEGAIIASGFLALTKFSRSARQGVAEHPSSLLSSIVLCSNVAFSGMLLFVLISQGVESLYAL